MLEKIFKRKIYERMLRWKQESDGHTALLIKGARRIGNRPLPRNLLVKSMHPISSSIFDSRRCGQRVVFTYFGSELLLFTDSVAIQCVIA